LKFKNNYCKEEINRFFIIILSLLISTFFSIVYLISRIGLDNINKTIVFKTLFLGYFILLAPYIVMRFLKSSRFKSSISIPGLDSVLTLIIIFLVTLVGFLQGNTSINLIIFFLILGAVFLFITLFDHKLSYSNKLPQLLIIIILFCLIIGIMGRLWGSEYTGPLFYPERIINGNVHIDTLFHASITNMIKTYGVPSTGIDGLVNVSYHWGSHWIFAQFSKLLDIGALNFYQIGFSIIFIPLLLKTMLMTILDIRSLHKKKISLNVTNDYIFWGILSLGFLGLIPKFFILAYNNSLITSESYLVSFIFTFLLISVLIFFEKSLVNRNWLKNFFYIVGLPIIVGVIGLCKVSLMVVVTGLLFYLFFRKQYYRIYIYIISLINTIIITLFIFFITTGINNNSKDLDLLSNNNLRLLPIRSDNKIILTIFIIIFLLIVFIWSLIYISLKIISFKNRRCNFFIDNHKLYKTLEIEILVITCFFGTIPPLVMDISNSAYYFYDIQRWIALIIILGGINSKIILERVNIVIKNNQKEKFISIIKRFIISVLALILITNSFYPAYEYLKFQHDTRKSIAGYFFKEDKEKILAKYELIEIFKELDGMPTKEKQNTIIYILQSNKIYWDLALYKGNKKCIANPFLAPAITGIAMIDGIPEYGCEISNFYGYAKYAPRKNSEDKDIKTIYNDARDKGFTNLIIINSDKYKLSIIKINPDNIFEFIE